MQIKSLAITGFPDLTPGKTVIQLDKKNIFTGKNTEQIKAVFRALEVLFNRAPLHAEDFAASVENQDEAVLEISACITFSTVPNTMPDACCIPELFHLLQISPDGEIFSILKLSASLKDGNISIKRYWIPEENISICADFWNHIRIIRLTKDIFTATLPEMPETFFPLYIMDEPERELTLSQLPELIRFINCAKENSQILIASCAKEILSGIAPEMIQFANGDLPMLELSSFLPPQTDSTRYIRQLLNDFPEIYQARLVVLSNCSSAAEVLTVFSRAYGADWKENKVVILPIPLDYAGHIRLLCRNLQIPVLSLFELHSLDPDGYTSGIATLMEQGKISGLPLPEDMDGSPVDPGDIAAALSHAETQELWLQWFAIYWQTYFVFPGNLDEIISKSFPEYDTAGKDGCLITHRRILTQIPQEILQQKIPAVCRKLIDRSIEILENSQVTG